MKKKDMILTTRNEFKTETNRNRCNKGGAPPPHLSDSTKRDSHLPILPIICLYAHICASLLLLRDFCSALF